MNNRSLFFLFAIIYCHFSCFSSTYNKISGGILDSLFLNSNKWQITQGYLCSDTVTHSLTFISDSVGVNACNIIPIFYKENDQAFYQIKGDSIILEGNLSYINKDSNSRELEIVIEQGNDQKQKRGWRLKPTLKYNDCNFSIKAPLNPLTNYISIHVVSEKGVQLKFDDIYFCIDEQKIERQSYLLFEADKDRSFNTGSGISLSLLSLQELENLELLAKVWGFIKYYHPFIAKGNLQWDYELFRMIPFILDSQNITDRNEKLLEWLKGINLHLPQEGNTLAIDTSNCIVYPNLSWIEDRQLLGDKLCNELIKIKNSKRLNWNYYIQFDDTLSHNLSLNYWERQFCGEKHYPTIRWDDQGFRLLTLFRYWNVIEYCYPYKNFTDTPWNEVLKKYLPLFLYTYSQEEYKRTILALTAEIDDSHGWTRWNFPYIYSAFFSYVEEKLVVSQSYNKELIAGDILLTMDGKSIDDIIMERGEYVSASNKVRKSFFVVEDINKWDKNKIEASVLRGKDTINILMSTFDLEKVIPEWETSISSFSYMKQMETNDIVYLHINDLTDKYMRQKEEQIKQSKGVILDCRGYPISDSFWTPLENIFLSRPTAYMKLAFLKIQEPGLFNIEWTGIAGSENPNAYKGKLVILVDQSTQSAAETLVMICQSRSNTITIGRQSSGANGGVRCIFLPGGIKTFFTGDGCYYPDLQTVQRLGVKIDIKVKESVEMFLQGRDSILEKAIDEILK